MKRLTSEELFWQRLERSVRVVLGVLMAGLMVVTIGAVATGRSWCLLTLAIEVVMMGVVVAWWGDEADEEENGGR